MADAPIFTLTSQKLADWRGEKELLERDIATRQKRLVEINERLKAAEVLMGKASGEATLFEIEAPSSSGATLIDTIEKIANESPSPVPKAELRDRLTALGFPPSSLTNYFYTVIMRLKNKQRITVRPDGSLWRAPPKS